MHKDNVKFLNYSQNATNFFPIPWAPAPFPKRGVRALEEYILLYDVMSGSVIITL